jgi:enamine deaminase RidA (YjgF/YER057c/UK114 family)
MSIDRPLGNHERVNVASGSMWEPLRGYSRAVRVGQQLFVSGTTAIDRNGDVVGVGDPYIQTRFVIERIRHVLTAAGFKLSDVVRSRLFVTQMGRWDEYAKAHREAFETIRPASSIVQVSKLVDPRLMIEMEVDAILGCTLVEQIDIEPVNASRGK